MEMNRQSICDSSRYSTPLRLLFSATSGLEQKEILFIKGLNAPGISKSLLVLCVRMCTQGGLDKISPISAVRQSMSFCVRLYILFFFIYLYADVSWNISYVHLNKISISVVTWLLNTSSASWLTLWYEGWVYSLRKVLWKI